MKTPGGARLNDALCTNQARGQVATIYKETDFHGTKREIILQYKNSDTIFSAIGQQSLVFPSLQARAMKPVTLLKQVIIKTGS